MNIKIAKPITSSKRHLIQLDKTYLKKKPLLKNQIIRLKKSIGRNNLGKVTIYHRGGGHKKRYRKLNFNRINESTGITTSLEYDPNRNSNIASIYDFSKKDFFYIIAPKYLKLGDIVKSGSNIEATVGSSLPLTHIPVGAFIHNVSSSGLRPAKFARSAGSAAILKEKVSDFARITLSSGEDKFISLKCYATIGIVSNELTFYTQKGKAGRSRWLNQRPKVRGVAMNPVDHPNGGGEGKKSGKGKNRWGQLIKKGKTSNSRNKLIVKELE